MSPLGACVWVVASVYSMPQTTSSGEWFSGKELTIALNGTPDPFGTWYFISFKGRDGIERTVPARYIDNGPFKKPRRADLSARVAKELKFPGLGFVCITRI